jgi:outer membrane protein OmpA-like peptidoglycan-associated protein
MRMSKILPAVAAVMLGSSMMLPAVAQGPQGPYVEMETTSVNAGLGGQSGDGMLRLPNLGTNCAYPFKISGFGAGVQVGISKASASGAVSNIYRVADLGGHYGASSGEATVLAGAGQASLKNQANNVQIALASNTQGLNIGFGGQGMTINIFDPPVNAPHAYVMEFGFNKTWVSQESRAVLDQVAAAWKCRFVNVWLFGHTDSVGKEDDNLKLAEARAAAARDYLIGAGLNPGRVMLQAKSEKAQLAPTENGVRLRTNRAVVVVIQDQAGLMQ